MRVDVLGPARVTGPGGAVTGLGLGGRRVRVALVALALADTTVPAHRLADMVWAGDPPPTWPAALRGVIRALRLAVTGIGLGGERLVATVPSGYALAPGVDVDVSVARDAVRDGARLLAEGRFAAAGDAVGDAAAMDGGALLAGEDLAWLAVHRTAVDEIRMRALEILADAAGGLGEHERAADHARAAVGRHPLDERTHRMLIRALDRAGDVAGAVQAYERCRTELADQLGVEPSQETAETYLAALRTQRAGRRATFPSNPSSFIGRERESARLAAALATPGLVVVTGPGGVGKSRLAMQAGTQMDARWWVPLGALDADELVASAVAMAVGVQVGAGDATEAVTRHLAAMGRMLLVLDGCESVLDGVASLASVLLAGCPLLAVLATSRVPVGVAPARVIRLGPLTPPPDEGRAGFTASAPVRLLRERVRERGGDLPLDDDTVPLVAAVCRRCAGLPLAIELVAAQLRLTSLDDLVADLSGGDPDDVDPDDGNRNLSGLPGSDASPDSLPDSDGRRDRDGLRAVLWRSHGLLERDEAVVFRRLAVLDGPVGLSFVRDVVAAGGIAPVRVARILHELAANGLLTVEQGSTRWWYRQEDSVRRFAAELLDRSGESAAAYARLGSAIRALLPDDARASPAPYQADLTDILACVRSFLGAAIVGRADANTGMEVAFRLHRYWAATDISEGRFWLSRMLGADVESAWDGYARFALGYLSYWSGDADAAIAELDGASARLRGHDDSYAARALIYLGGLADDLDRGSDALAYIRDAIALTEQLDDPDLQVAARVGMGAVLAERADPQAAHYAVLAVEACRRGGSAEQLAILLPTAATVCWQVDALGQAREYVREALPLHTRTRRIARVVALAAAAGVALADGDIPAAVDFARRADAEGTELGIERELPLARCLHARALLAGGDVAGAAAQALAAVHAAGAVSFVHPLEPCLETVVLVGLAHGGADPVDLARLLRTSDTMRAHGQRPGPPSLQAAVDAARARLDLTATGTLTPTEAVALAVSVATACGAPQAARGGLPKVARAGRPA